MAIWCRGWWPRVKLRFARAPCTISALKNSLRDISFGKGGERGELKRTNERVGIISFVFRFRISRVLIDTAYAPGVYNLLSIVVPLVVSTVPNSKR